MKPPFPGMDPYLEGDLWSEVHTELASKIKKMLIPLLGDKYIARIEKYIINDTEPHHDIGIVYPMYPDVAVFEDKVSEAVAVYGNQKIPTPSNLKVRYHRPMKVKINVVEIRDVKDNKIITAIEILSPVNKRGLGLKQYLARKERLINNHIHFIEVDLIRRGTRTVTLTQLDGIDYLVALTRANTFQTEVWTINLATALPTIPVPLIAPDEDVLIDLQTALDEVYEESAFHRSINYEDIPPPPVILEEKYRHFTKKVNV